METNEPLVKRIGYVAHQIHGDAASNIQSVLGILKEIRLNAENREEWEGIIPIAPYLVPLLYLDDNDPEQRAMGIEENGYYFKRGLIDELILAGPCISRGMREEIRLAAESGIPISCYNPGLQDGLEEVLADLGGANNGIRP